MKSPTDDLMDTIERAVRWYETNKPESTQRISIDAKPKLIAKALRVEYNPGQREFVYRGRAIVSITEE